MTPGDVPLRLADSVVADSVVADARRWLKASSQTPGWRNPSWPRTWTS